MKSYDNKEYNQFTSLPELNWIRKELMTHNLSKKCCAKTKLGHRCTHKYTHYYVHTENKESALFLCNIHEKKLLKDGHIMKCQS